jgi:hypothetical protein
MEATRRNLQARLKILKKLSEHQINQSEQLKTKRLKLSSENINLKRRSVKVERKKVMGITKFADKRQTADDRRRTDEKKIFVKNHFCNDKKF